MIGRSKTFNNIWDYFNWAAHNSNSRVLVRCEKLDGKYKITYYKKDYFTY